MNKAYFGGKEVVKVMLGDKVLWQKSQPINIDFVNQTYKRGTTLLTFNDVFGFTRESKAWLVNGAVIDEYAINAPRFKDGLLLERSATNYTSYSFLPELGVNYLRAGIDFINGYWTVVTSAATRYLYTRPYAPIVSGNVVGSVGTVQSVVFDNIVLEGSRITATSLGKVNYAVKDGLARSTTSGVVTDSNALNGTQLLYVQIENGVLPTSPIKTQGAPVTRQADIIGLKSVATSVTGDWDSTLSLSIVNGQLTHSGYGKIRSLSIT